MKIKLYIQGWEAFKDHCFTGCDFSDLCKESILFTNRQKNMGYFPNWVSITFNQIHMIILLFVTDPNFKTEHEKGKK